MQKMSRKLTLEKDMDFDSTGIKKPPSNAGRKKIAKGTQSW
jgi:hypothetical protein